jgi:hypothetical protein
MNGWTADTAASTDPPSSQAHMIAALGSAPTGLGCLAQPERNSPTTAAQTHLTAQTHHHQRPAHQQLAGAPPHHAWEAVAAPHLCNSVGGQCTSGKGQRTLPGSLYLGASSSGQPASTPCLGDGVCSSRIARGSQRTLPGQWCRTPLICWQPGHRKEGTAYHAWDIPTSSCFWALVLAAPSSVGRQGAAGQVLDEAQLLFHLAPVGGGHCLQGLGAGIH